MEDVESIVTLDGEEHIIAAVHHIIKALGASKTLSSDVRRLLADLDIHLSTATKLKENDAARIGVVEDRLKYAESKLSCVQSSHLSLWDSGSQEGFLYLETVDEVRRLIDNLDNTPLNNNKKQSELLNKAHSVLQMGMERLEQELINILVQNKQCFDLDDTTFYSCDDNIMEEEPTVSDDSSVEDTSRKQSNETEPEKHVMDLIHPDVIPHLKSIANLMFSSQYGQEFCQALISFWKDAIDEYLHILDVEQFSTEDVLAMEWKRLNHRIKKWRHAVKELIGFYLPCGKRLFDQLLGEFLSFGSSCFAEASKTSVFCLLNFGHAVAIGPHQPERLFLLLDMYELVRDLCQTVDGLFVDDAGSFIRIEFYDLLKALCSSAKIIFLQLGNRVATNNSCTPLVNGGIHPITKYVLNYITLLAEYADTLNFLLEEQGKEELDQSVHVNGGQNTSSNSSSPVGCHLQSVMSILESNLDDKSNLYKDGSLKHIFMMNNIHYMVEKIKSSKIRLYFGDDWMRKHIGKYQKHAINYERITWFSILSLIRDDGNKGKAVLREKCRKFSLAFEEVYKIQTGWYIPDHELREDVRISISLRLIQAYRNFVGRIKESMSDKYIKYSESDLEQYILDFFQHSPQSLNHSRRR